MIFFTHENFPALAGVLLRTYEHLHEVRVYSEEYPPGEPVEAWVTALGKQAQNWRPVIITIDDGVKGNAVGRAVMRDSRCTFVRFARQWSKTPWEEFVWKLFRAWPSVVAAALEAHAENRQCVIDVTINGRAQVSNL